MKPRVLFFQFLALFASGVSVTPLLSDRDLGSLGFESLAAGDDETVPDTHVQHEVRSVQQGRRWVKLDRADAQAMLPMRIGLKQHSLERGHDLLMDISDPTSENYGKHLTATEVVDFFAPSEAGVAAVREWLVESGIAGSTITQSMNKQWLQFDTPVRQAEDLLAARYHIYEHEDSGARTVACEKYHVPKLIQEHIDYITPGIKLKSLGESHETRSKGKKRSTYRGGQGPERFVLPVKMLDPTAALKAAVHKTGSTNDGPGIPWNIPFPLDGDCDAYMTPECIRREKGLYRVPKGTKAHPSNKMGIFQGLGQKYTQHDLDTFFQGFTDGIPNGTHPELRSINGGLGVTTNLSLAGLEANLDFQMAYGLIWPQQTVLYSVDDEYYQDSQANADSPYKGFFNTILILTPWYVRFLERPRRQLLHLQRVRRDGQLRARRVPGPVVPGRAPRGARGGYQGPLMCGTHARTNVVAISYSGGEADLPYSYQRRQCAEILKLALQGTTVLVGSGDDGVASVAGDPAPNGCLGPRHDVFHPQFLSTCPYVLSVGSTLLPPGKKPDDDSYGSRSPSGSDAKGQSGGERPPDENPETPTVRFPSGGGFSNIYPRPPWQHRHVEGYFAQVRLPFDGYDGGRPREGLFLGDPSTTTTMTTSDPDHNSSSHPSNATADGGTTGGGRFNRLGRAYPDVAANGDNFVVAHRGGLARVGGTSAACPLFGSLLSLVNEERLAAGKRGPVGFVNPVLYAHPEVFRDVATGANRGCGAGPAKKPMAFPAAKGVGSRLRAGDAGLPEAVGAVYEFAVG
ncbi:uncharacterized protein PG998_010311 [Apiospora kogelbergensis]|uniref:uncharacterized protein n=1 Tax=Apiospora kogelbergensis TaxID=1337665 RepID=UPI0031329168